jgi:hypothetical protein
MAAAPRTVAGASDHYARAEIVVVSGGATPRLVERRQVPLIQAGLPIAPYHHEALELDLDAAQDLVDQVRDSVERCAREAIQALIDDFGVEALALQSSPYPDLPGDLEEVLASRHLTNAADGMLYREILADQAEVLGLEVLRYPRKQDPARLAAEALGCEIAEVEARIAAFGERAGPPWRKDHRLAAAAALLLLGERG